MNILIITQMYWQPEKDGDNGETKTVNYFARDWAALGHKVIVVHCPSKFWLPLYYIPKFVKNYIRGSKNMIVPSIESRKNSIRDEGVVNVVHLPIFKCYPGQAFSDADIKNHASKIVDILMKYNFVPNLISGHFANPSIALVDLLGKKFRCMSSIVFHYDCNWNTYKKYGIKESISNIGAVGVRSVVEQKEVSVILGLRTLPFLCYSGVPDYAVAQRMLVCLKHDFSSGIKFLAVGELIGRKHFDSVLKAFSKLDIGCNLSIVGKGVKEGELKTLSCTLDIQSRVNFLGHITREQVMQEMRNAQIFTLISSGEVFGMVYIEAMLQGCIVVASKGGGFDGIIKDGVNGFLCTPGDAEELEQVYRRIIDMSMDERNKIGQAAIETAARYSESQVAKDYLDEVLKRNGAILA